MTKLREAQLTLDGNKCYLLFHDRPQPILDLKATAERLFATPEADLPAAFRDFVAFEARLNALVATVARYRIQLAAPEAAPFGPRTLKAVEVGQWHL